MNRAITDWKNKRVWLIGASTGIGFALATLLAQKGAQVIISSRDSQRLAQAALALGDAQSVVVDVCDLSSVEQATAQVTQSAASLDAVIYLAGDYEPMSSLQFNVARAQKIIDVNLKGAINVMACVLPILQKQEHGLIALTASIAGYRGLPNSLAYGASKAGLINLAQSTHAELIDTPIDVRVINPGFVKTPLTDKNKFAMPCLITPEQAAQAIIKGLATNAFEIHFPKQFSLLMKVISSLPDKLYFALVKRFK